MQTALIIIFWWFAINFIGAAVWTCYRMWRPRRCHSWKVDPDATPSSFWQPTLRDWAVNVDRLG
jgi:hypothetical protein